MFDDNENDFAPIALDSEDTDLEHRAHCDCRKCDPDFYIDPAEHEAGSRELRW